MSTESSTQHQSKRLPDSWVQRIFSTMQGHYGTRFINMWKTGQILPDGNDAGILNAMHHWSEKLGWYGDHPECVKHVLEHLPEDPPSLPQFLNLLRTAPRIEPRKLEHKLTAEQMEKNKQRVKEMIEGLKNNMAMKGE